MLYIIYVSKSTNLRELLGGVVCPEIFLICYGIFLGTCHEIYPTEEKNTNKIMVSRNLHQAHLLEVGLTKIPGDHETLSIVRHVGLHVDFSSMKSSLGL